VGDVVIVVAYANMTLEEARDFRPTVIIPDERTNTLKA
jgi:aspartate 1-decarboxylase